MMEIVDMEPSQLYQLHDASSNHRERLKTGSCFYCLSSFSVDRVKQWIDADQTALCPHCGIDAVIPSEDMTRVAPSLTGWEILSTMKHHWFDREGYKMKDLENHVEIRSLQHRSHANASRKGFWDKRADGAKPSYAEKLMLVVCEVSEAMEELRKKGIEPQDIYYGEDGKPEGFGIELADAVIRICDVAQEAGVDLGDCITIKEKFNETRPYMHGRKA